MNTFFKAVVTATVTALPFMSQGQRISHTPVKDETTARTRLFNLPPGDTNYYFRANLPGDNFLVIEFKQLSYWPGKGTLPDVIATAKQTIAKLQDSFTNAVSARKVAIHVPANNAQVLAEISEHARDEKLMVMKNGAALPLRIGMDTISVLKTFEQKGKDTSNKRQIRYTLILKDLQEINGIAENTALIDDIDQTFDSLVQYKRSMWSHQDAIYHTLDAEYNPGLTGKQRLITARNGTVLKALNFTIESGATYIYNTLLPYFNEKLSYRWPGNNGHYGFIGLSYSGLSFLRQVNNDYEMKNMGFLNLEIGSVNDDRNSLIPIQRLSVGFGYRVNADKPTVYDLKYKFFFSYSISKVLTLSTELFSIPKKGDQAARTFAGVTLAFRILEFIE